MKISYIKIAWRNLWRNKRRTAITTASILFAVFFAVFMRSFQLGFYDHMIKNAIESFSGFLQVQHINYQDDPSLENTFECNDDFIVDIRKTEGIKAAVPRVETFALASSGNQTKGALVLGIDPESEKELSNPETFMVRFRITREVMKKLKESDQLSPEVKKNLSYIENRSYPNLETIALDLDVDPDEQKESLGLIASLSEIRGNYLTQDDDGVLVSDRLAKYLKLNIGDSLILMGQGYHGATAAGIYPVRGLVRIPNPELDNKLVYMTIGNAQYLTGLGNRVTTLAINLYDNSEKNMLLFEEKLNETINDPNVVVKNWMEFNEVLKQQIEGDSQSGQAFLALLYFIIFFGIFGTVLMMIHERKREFGVMVAVGMQKTRLAIIFVYEMFLIGILGVLAGTAVSLPILFYFNRFPVRLRGELAQIMENYGFEAVMPLQWIDMYVLWQGLIVALMVVLSCLYPLRKVFTLKEIDALRA
jgi:ABC-type lipoprotein release transport system permease subunit